ncbi:hypothetical protein [Mycoplasma sp. Z1473D]
MKQNKDFLQLVEASLFSFNKLNEVINEIYENQRTWEYNNLACTKKLNLGNSEYEWRLNLELKSKENNMEQKFVYRLWVVDNSRTLYADPDDPEDFIEYGDYQTLEEVDTEIKKFITDTLWEWEDIIAISPKTLEIVPQDMRFRRFTYEDIKNNFKIEKIYLLENNTAEAGE